MPTARLESGAANRETQSGLRARSWWSTSVLVWMSRYCFEIYPMLCVLAYTLALLKQSLLDASHIGSGLRHQRVE